MVAAFFFVLDSSHCLCFVFLFSFFFQGAACVSSFLHSAGVCCSLPVSPFFRMPQFGASSSSMGPRSTWCEHTSGCLPLALRTQESGKPPYRCTEHRRVSTRFSSLRTAFLMRMKIFSFVFVFVFMMCVCVFFTFLRLPSRVGDKLYLKIERSVLKRRLRY